MSLSGERGRPTFSRIVQKSPRPQPHHELVQLLCFAAQAWVTADLVGQGHDLARAA